MSECSQIILDTIDPNECLSSSLSKMNSNFSILDNFLGSLRQRIETTAEIRTFFYYGPNSQVAPGSGMEGSQISRPSDITIEAFVNSPSELNLPSISKPGDVAYVIYQKSGFQGPLPSQSSGFNPETGSDDKFAAGRPVILDFNKWYNVDDYYSITGSLEGEQPDNMGNIKIQFKSPTGEISEFKYTAKDNWDVYMEWGQRNVIWSEAYPQVQGIKGIAPRPFKETPGVQFIYLAEGNYYVYSLTGYLKKISTTPAVNYDSITKTDLITRFLPTYVIWKLRCVEDGFYYVELGFPKFSTGFASNNGAANSNWNKPENWATFDSWVP